MPLQNTEEYLKPNEMPDEMYQPIDDKILRPQFKSKIITPNRAKRKTRENISNLERLTGQIVNISL